jgi:protein TonB
MLTSPDAQAHAAPRLATAAPARSAETPGNRAYNSPSEYLRLLALRLAEVKRYPAAAVARREEGVVLLAFRLDRSGRILSWEIARSSGHDELDAEASRMVAQAAPFPPFPAAWRETTASFQVPIGFSLY